MPATAARITFVSQPFRSVVAQNAAIQTRYGKAARDTLDQPVETFFEDVADAQIIANERFTLLSADRRLFEVTAAELLTFSGGLAFNQTAPTVTLIDDEKAANLTAIIASVEAKDYEQERTILRVWG